MDVTETESKVQVAEGQEAERVDTTYEFNITARFVSMVEDDTEEEAAADAVLEETSAE